MSATDTPPTAMAALSARLVALCTAFNLSTLAVELVARFERAGHKDVLPLLTEVFELEAQDRLERRIDRLRRASRLPPGKTMATFDQTRFARPLVDKLRALGTGDFLDCCRSSRSAQIWTGEASVITGGVSPWAPAPPRVGGSCRLRWR